MSKFKVGDRVVFCIAPPEPDVAESFYSLSHWMQTGEVVELPPVSSDAYEPDPAWGVDRGEFIQNVRVKFDGKEVVTGVRSCWLVPETTININDPNEIEEYLNG